jgi:D-sedoheptulose 7-phosphate isomerase
MPSPTLNQETSLGLGPHQSEKAASKARRIQSYLEEGAALRLSSVSLSEKIIEASETIALSFKNGGKLMTFGNGGSAADAQHIAAEFTGRFRYHREALPAIALTSNSSQVTAIANDYKFEEVFSRQLRGLAKPVDVAMGISTSGNSKNVLNGLAAARDVGAKTIGLTGNRGTIPSHCDVLLAVPSDNTSFLQEIHIAIGHLICLLVEEDLFG